jgi:hypothetical protein
MGRIPQALGVLEVQAVAVAAAPMSGVLTQISPWVPLYQASAHQVDFFALHPYPHHPPALPMS